VPLTIARELRPEVPFIFVSGTIGEEYAIQALKNGATDYVLKHDLARLPPAVERALQDAAGGAAAEQRRMHAAPQHSELRFRLAASTGDVWDWTVSTGAAYISHQWKRRLGYGSPCCTRKTGTRSRKPSALTSDTKRRMTSNTVR